MPLKIFYLDDEAELCELFKDIFSSDTAQIQTFTDVNALMQTTMKESPDLIFLDYRLPNTTGIEVAEKLDSSIPKVLITGDISLITNFQFERIFQKPLKLEEIHEFIDGYTQKLLKTQ